MSRGDLHVPAIHRPRMLAHCRNADNATPAVGNRVEVCGVALAPERTRQESRNNTSGLFRFWQGAQVENGDIAERLLTYSAATLENRTLCATFGNGKLKPSNCRQPSRTHQVTKRTGTAWQSRAGATKRRRPQRRQAVGGDPARAVSHSAATTDGDMGGHMALARSGPCGARPRCGAFLAVFWARCARLPGRFSTIKNIFPSLPYFL